VLHWPGPRSRRARASADADALDATRALNMNIANNGSFLDSESGSSSLVTFTRASAGTYFNSSGAIATAAIDAARFDYNSSTLAARGLLVEEARTNLCIRSQELDNAAWATTVTGSGSVTVTANQVAAPDGTTTAELFAINRSVATDRAQRGSTAFVGTVATYTLSVWLKAKDAASVGKVIDIWLFDGATSVGTAVTLTAVWTRYTYSRTLAASAACAMGLGYPPNTMSGSGLGTGLAEFYAWGVQVELGSFASSYVATAAAAVTRAADIATMTGTNFSDWYVAATGTFVVDFDVMSIAAGTRGILSADNNTADERIEFYNSTADPKTIIVDGAATQADLDAGTLVANTAAKLGLSYAANDAAASLNGGAAATDVTVTLPAPDRLRIGVNQAGNYLNGHVKSIKYYNVAKTDAELQSLTT
jgi:hypothetical protein